jgi:NhaP-type Na+/H+ or K+/H+ antiporter
MIIPIRVLFNLRISLVEKFSIGVVFVVGIITMIFAVVRVVSLNSSVNGGQVSTTWLMLWAGIEGVVGMSLSLPTNLHLEIFPQNKKYQGTWITALICFASPSNHRRLPTLLRNLHPRPRREVARPLRTLRSESL